MNPCPGCGDSGVISSYDGRDLGPCTCPAGVNAFTGPSVSQGVMLSGRQQGDVYLTPEFTKQLMDTAKKFKRSAQSSYRRVCTIPGRDGADTVPVY